MRDKLKSQTEQPVKTFLEYVQGEVTDTLAESIAERNARLTRELLEAEGPSAEMQFEEYWGAERKVN